MALDLSLFAGAFLHAQTHSVRIDSIIALLLTLDPGVDCLCETVIKIGW